MEPEFPATPPAAVDPEDSGCASGIATEANDTLEVHPHANDYDFSSPGASGTGNLSGNNKNANEAAGLPADFDPKKPPPNLNKNSPKVSPSKQVSTATDASGAVRRRVVVRSVESKGKKPGPITDSDLLQFRARLEIHQDEENDKLSLEDDPVSFWTPFIERNSIVIPPTDAASGKCLINLVNQKILVIQGHTVMAGWNVNLPEVCTISVRWESISSRDPFILIEDPKKGIARMNRWKLEGKEISFLNWSPDPKNDKVVFARVLVSKNVCNLIQQQRGQLLMSGGNATAQWPANNGKLLDTDNHVTFDFQ